MENTKIENSFTIKVTYSYKSIVRSFFLSEGSCLYEYFVRHNHVISRNNELCREGFTKLDEQIKKLAQSNIEKQNDYNHDGYPMDIIVWRNDIPVYFMKHYYSENEIQEIITKIFKK